MSLIDMLKMYSAMGDADVFPYESAHVASGVGMMNWTPS